MNSISANLNVMIKAVEKASKKLIRDFGELEKLQASKKKPEQFAKNAKSNIEKIILDELIRARPNYSILTEQFGMKYKKDENNIWILKPIDGEINFLHGIPHFAISISLQSLDEIKSGLIFDPIKNELFYAEKNEGAYFNNKRIRVSNKNQIKDCLFSIENKLENESSLNFRTSGSIALDLAYVAAGRYDGLYKKNLNLCDIAAGIILIKEAGGLINNLELKSLKNITILTSSSEINSKFRQSVNYFS